MNTNIKSTTTNKHLSAMAGLDLFAKCWQKFRISVSLAALLPKTRSSSKKFGDLALGFAAGLDCLDDMTELSKDQGFLAVCSEKVYSPKSYGDYLREFSSVDINETNRALARSAFQQRALATKKMKSMILDFDSTFNRQYARKMEGVAYNGEKKQEGLTSMYVFDELGFQYYGDVRPGDTHTSDSISKIIHMVMSQLPKEASYASEQVYLPWQKTPYRKDFRVFARGDAGYSNNEFINACDAKGIGFVVRMHANMLNPKIKNITNWKPTKKRLKQVKRRNGDMEPLDTTIKFYDGRSCEIGTTLYHNNNISSTCRIVCLRAKKEGALGLSVDDYDYFAWLTNIGEHEMGNEQVIFFYRKRGHAENYIREAKNGYDMHHYPCLKLNANRAYAIIGAFAHNILRFMAIRSANKKVQFAKAIRNKLIFLPCQVVRHAGQVIFKYMEEHAREVELFLKDLKTLQHGYT
jgi:hypothetical protein